MTITIFIMSMQVHFYKFVMTETYRSEHLICNCKNSLSTYSNALHNHLMQNYAEFLVWNTNSISILN